MVTMVIISLTTRTLCFLWRKVWEKKPTQIRTHARYSKIRTFFPRLSLGEEQFFLYLQFSRSVIWQNRVGVRGQTNIRFVEISCFWTFSIVLSLSIYVCMYVQGMGHKIQPLHRDLQWPIVLLSLSKNIVLFIFQNTTFRRLDSVSVFR
jgi:hypothetical protein